MTTHELTRPGVQGAARHANVNLSAASGLLGFALAITAIVLGATTGTVAANPGASADEIARAYGTASSPLVPVGALLQMLALLCLFGFVTCLADNGRSDWVSRLTVGA